VLVGGGERRLHIQVEGCLVLAVGSYKHSSTGPLWCSTYALLTCSYSIMAIYAQVGGDRAGKGGDMSSSPKLKG
jgi:hypothetical protein